VPPGVVTVTSGVPVPAGETAEREVVPVEVTEVAAWPAPKATVEPVVNPLPVMVTVVPPATGPSAGLIAVTAGAMS